MGLIDEADEQQKLPGIICSVQRILTDMDEADADDLRALLWGPQFKHIKLSAISRTLDKRGIRVQAAMLARHRRGECSNCQKANS